MAHSSLHALVLANAPKSFLAALPVTLSARAGLTPCFFSNVPRRGLSRGLGIRCSLCL